MKSRVYRKGLMRIFHFLIILLVCGASVRYNPRLDFERFSVERGLSQNVVEAIHFDRYGFIWFGTQDGLNRFDGFSFKTYYYSPRHPNSLSHNYVTCITQTDSLTLWVATYGGGLNKFDLTTEQFTSFTIQSPVSQRMPDNVVYHIYNEGDSVLWLGTKAGMARMRLATLEVEHYSAGSATNQLSDPTVYAIKRDKKGRLWVATRNGLNRMDESNGTFVKYFHEPQVAHSISSDDIRVLLPGKDGHFYIGTRTGGINRYHEDSDSFQNHATGHLPKLPNSYVRALHQTESDKMWIGTFGGGFHWWDFTTGALYTYLHDPASAKSLSDNRVVAIGSDPSGSVWIGTHGGGVNRVNPYARRFQLFQRSEENPTLLSDNAVNAIFEGKDGTLLIGTDKGIDRVKKTRHLDHFDHDFEDFLHPSVGEKRVWSMYQDASGKVWVGIWGEGLYLLDILTGKLKENYRHQPDNPASLTTDYVEVIREISPGVLWLGMIGDGGVCILDTRTGQIQRVLHDEGQPESLSNNRVHAITKDSRGRVWVGTDLGLELWLGEGNRFRHFHSDPTDPKSINYNLIRVIHESRDGTIWVGTGGGGLTKITETNGDFVFDFITTTDGLSNNNVSGILEDEAGNLWVSTFQGLNYYQLSTGRIIKFGLNDGLQGLEFFRNSFAKTSDGMMYFGGLQGLNAFHPQTIRINSYKPPVIITKVDILSRDTLTTLNPLSVRHITLYPRDYLLNIEFSALDFTDIPNNTYSYILEGFNDQWVELGNRRFVTFTNLPPGDFILHIRASNNDGVWNNEGVKIRITVVPPLWKRPWFRVILGLFIALSVITYVRLRLRSLKHAKVDLEHKVKERTLELSELNSALLEKQVMVNDQNEQILQQLEEIAAQRDDIESTNKELLSAQEIIREQNEELKAINTQLEDQVNERTTALTDSNKRLLAVNHELDTFFYRASHDLKGPVATIQGLCYLAERENKDEVAGIYLQKIGHTAQHLSKVIFNLQKLNIIKTATLKPQMVHLVDLIEFELEEVLPSAEDRADISFTVDATITTIETDANMMRIIVENMISNAIKFAKKDSQPEIRIEIHPAPMPGMVKILFKDKGEGIAPELGSRVFDMFFVGQEHQEGLGLGLYSVKMAAEKLGGQVSVLKDPDFATAFEVVIPDHILPQSDLDKSDG
jgi:ligand-binding sensor domain-containing protein/signal transduction histidine kinase